jgi:uncharacterized protein YecT (DUF1311 family)
MSLRRTFLFSASVFLLSNIVVGEDIKIPCRNAPSEAERGQCLAKAVTQAEGELGRRLTSTAIRIEALDMPKQEKEAYKASVRRAEEAWRIYRDTQCDEVLLHSNYGGSGAGNAKAECRWSKTISRIKELSEQ